MTLPNQLTVLRILLTPLFVILLVSGNIFFKELSVAVYAAAALTDWYDGWVARKFGTVTKWGNFLDPLADKILTSSAFMAFAWLGLVGWWMVWAIVVRDISITLLRSFAEFRGHGLHTNFSAKVKTFTQMVFIYGVLIAFVMKSAAFETSAFLNMILSKGVLFYSMLRKS
ncbi:MAG: CDP-diacylglycerol--glycerol-3-phosphate 3-phosphatidyltransferase, partial [Bacteroidetes bacterium]|nr:CDP-diacylglycerol--glycerol-3-phosphate 3-phosphatidyltransferase [Bacteroidota bacterium]